MSEERSIADVIGRMNMRYSTSHADGFHKAQAITKRLAEGLHTLHKEINVVTDMNKWQKFIEEVKANMTVAIFDSWEGHAFDHVTNDVLCWSKDESNIEIHCFGSEKFIDRIRDTIDTCELVPFDDYMKWYYNEKGHSVKLPIFHEKLPCTEMYPFLEDEQLEDYYQRFIDDDASVLLLIGPPGTGKTSFLKGLLAYAKSSASISYNLRVLDDDEIFVNFLTGSTQFMIMEDCDNFLEAREDGNSMMHRFLNISDGLVSVKGKKLIFTTNLENTNNIDEALIRPGRCFDILRFDSLNREQAEALATKHNRDLQVDKSSYSIADVFAQPQIHAHKAIRKVGF